MVNERAPPFLGGWLLLLVVLSLLPWPAQAGTATAPEVSDPGNDRSITGTIPLGAIPLPLADAADITAAWVAENSTAMFFNIQLAGELEGLLGSPGLIGEPFGLLVLYDYVMHFTFNGTDRHASVRIGDDLLGEGIEPGDLATVATVSGNVVNLTVPKSAPELKGLRPGQVLSNLEVEATGTLTGIAPLDLAGLIEDAATGTIGYTIRLANGGTATDTDADGLPDATEQEEFGDLNETGSGDPDGDGLNNSAEIAAGTDPNDPDTDGDLLPDGQDPFPLDPTKPFDSDSDGLPDAWEREHFGSITAQTASGDPDNDGLTNLEEYNLGTDPNKADTDGDGATDDNDGDPRDPNVGADDDGVVGSREVEPELYAGAGMFAAAATFILLGLAKGI